MRIFVTLVLAFAAFAAEAVTIRSKGDLRLWQTVFDRSAPLAWNWSDGADAATVTFRTVKATGGAGTQYGETRVAEVARATPESRRGSCPLPVFAAASPETLVEATLSQTSNSVGVACETARLAFVSGAGTGGAITVRVPATHPWYRVAVPRVSGFDAAWWGLEGSSGYEVLWADPPGWHDVGRVFGEAGTVDTARLRFGTTGHAMVLR